MTLSTGKEKEKKVKKVSGFVDSEMSVGKGKNVRGGMGR